MLGFQSFMHHFNHRTFFPFFQIIFTATRHHVEFLNELLTHSGLAPSVVYGTMDQTARKIHIGKFRAQKTRLLIVTDVAARGIDIPLLDNVINYGETRPLLSAGSIQFFRLHTRRTYIQRPGLQFLQLCALRFAQHAERQSQQLLKVPVLMQVGFLAWKRELSYTVKLRSSD